MSIKTVLEQLDGGTVVQRIDEELAHVVEAVQETHDAGSLTIKLTITDKGMGRAEVKAKVESKVPQHALPASLWFFSNVPGNLTRENERQTKLEFLPKEKQEERP